MEGSGQCLRTLVRPYLSVMRVYGKERGQVLKIVDISVELKWSTGVRLGLPSLEEEEEC